MLRITTYALGIVFAACASAALAAPKDEMLATDKAFSAMSASKGEAAAFLAYMADDALYFQGDHPPIIGRAAVAAFFAAREKDPGAATERLVWTPLSADASADGTLGYTRGEWTLTANKKDGSPLKLTGFYLTEWRRGADGKYKLVADIGGAFGQ